MEKRRRRSTYGDFAQKILYVAFQTKNEYGGEGYHSGHVKEPHFTTFHGWGHILGLFLGAE